MNAPPTPRQPANRLRLFLLLSVSLIVASFVVRLSGSQDVLGGEGILLSDNDTMRRLSRLEALARADSYPVTETMDGHPGGTVSHWTRPMDLYLQALDPLASLILPGARGHEAAAVLAGPVLAILSLVLFLWAAERLFGGAPALVAAAFYSLLFPVVSVSRIGNGDHQNLQHFFLLGFAMLWLLDLEQKSRTIGTVLSGLALGCAVWVSTESWLIVLAWAAVTFCLVLAPSRANLVSAEILRASTLLGTLLLGHLVEHASLFAVDWDRISLFHAAQALLFLIFLLLVRGLPRALLARPWLAALLALAAGPAALLVVPGLHHAIEEQLFLFERSNRWVQAAVSEYRSSFRVGDGYSLGEGIRRYSFMLLPAPIFVAAVARCRTLTREGRLQLLLMTTASFLMAAYEAKLGHLFALWFPLALIAGGLALRDRWLPEPGVARRLASAAFAVALVVAVLVGLPGPPSQVLRISNQGVRDICRFLRAEDKSGSVMAPWDLSASLMYYGRSPVVASGYHRNLAGILDGYRFYLARPEEDELARRIVSRRRVRFVVAWYDRLFFREAQRVLDLGDEFLLSSNGAIRFTAEARRSMFWRLRHGPAPRGYTLRYESPILVQLAGGRSEPLFKIYEVD